ncbi:MAG: zf-HC2 domain-containing protein [Acidobacteria bacterium]|nr:zf-HC2 domain-containing protein [Acidobacteriota bacterium]
MKCIRVEKFLPLYAAGDLTGRRRERAVEKHLATCEPCRRAAAEYQASRELFRAAALSPDFDGAFYEELRNSVLARIRRDRTLAPPSGFSRLFNARLAYAASLALLLVAAALALHNYSRRAPEDGARQKMIADANRERPATPAAIKTPAETRTQSGERPAPRPSDEPARAATGRERRAAKSSLSKPGGNIENARKGSPPSLNTMARTPSNARRNPLAPAVAAVAAARGKAGEIAATSGGGGGDGGTAPQPEVSRIEIQTSDPNIRIIWLSPHAEDAARPLK